MTKIYHNPRCSKSRAALKILQQQNIEPEVVLYLVNHPTKEEILNLLSLLPASPMELVRTKESEFQGSGLNAESDANSVAEAIVRFPKLLERPVVVHKEKAIIGRPPERILNLL